MTTSRSERVSCSTTAIIRASVSIRQGAAFAEAVDAVMENVVPAMEMALGCAFTANTIDFSVHGLGIAPGGAATLSIV